MRLAQLDLLKHALSRFNIRMLTTFKEAGLFALLLKLYSVFPFADILLQTVTSIFATALQPPKTSDDTED